jgi:hypothetical protein
MAPRTGKLEIHSIGTRSSTDLRQLRSSRQPPPAIRPHRLINHYALKPDSSIVAGVGATELFAQDGDAEGGVQTRFRRAICERRGFTNWREAVGPGVIRAFLFLSEMILIVSWRAS